MLNEISNKYVSAVYKGIILIPTFLSWIVIQYIVFALLSVDRGIVNGVISLFGKEPIYWYSEPKYWKFIMPFAYLWKNVGYYSALYLAAISGISTDYYEAEQIGGATKWEQIKHITLKHGMPGGGYIFSTSNCIYTGMPLKRYELMLDIWSHEGIYVGESKNTSPEN